MNDSGDQRLSALDRRDNRRWFIGLGISVGFGLFGVIMTLLSYSNRTPAAGATPAAQRAGGNAPAGRTRAEPADREHKPRNRNK